MEHKHLDAAALERLLAIDRTAEQNDLLFHLLSVCPGCRQEGGWLLELQQARALPPLFGSIDVALARSRAEAPRLLELIASDPQDRVARLHVDPRFVSWGLCELLIRESCQIAPEQPSQAGHLAHLAVQIADLIPVGEPFEESWVDQLRSLAWASLGNAGRVQGDLSGAEMSFERSDSSWDMGTADSEDTLGYEPVILDLKASFRMAQRRFSEALGLLDQAVILFREGEPEQRDPHLAGRSLILKAFVLIEQGASESAIQVLKKANGLIDPARDPRLLLCVRHNLVDNLSKMGRHSEAADLLPDLRELAAAHGSSGDHLRLQWVEGRIAAGLGDFHRARTLLAEVRQTFLADGNLYEAALATLDLVVPGLQDGRISEVRELVDEMVTVFRDHDVPREALAALLLFQEAARRETATTDLAREVAASLSKTSMRD
jgi:tetratricopeptide (TPR) repeat protein